MSLEEKIYEKGCILRVEKAQRTANIFSKKVEQLKKFDRYIEVNIPVEMDDGSLNFYIGYRCQHNMFRGPYKGGIRFHPSVNLEELKAMSFWMTLKNAILDLPLGGAKGGVIVDTKKLSSNEIENLSRGYVKKMYPVLGSQFDIPAPDMNTNENIIDFMTDEFKKYNSKEYLASFTGKSIKNSGISLRTCSTGYGGVIILNHFLQKNQNFKRTSKLKISIQGFGNVSKYFCEMANKSGHLIVAISDSTSAIYNPEGINISKAINHKSKYHSFKNFEEGYTISNQELLDLEVDVLVPAAMENSINNQNYQNIKSRLILEMANGPVSSDVDEILCSKGIIILPDVLCNAGGVCVSYYEWLQNLNNKFYTDSDVLEKLQKLMIEAFENVDKIRSDYQTDYRNASYILSLLRLNK